MELQAETGSAAKALSVVLRDVAAVQRYYMPNIKGGGVLVETP
ncbi:pilus assembly protein PilZ, partial [Acidithiobacillus ferriphilus]|nr:pilus assembly protein PilZ [Acidithiobacillus ferriphilus]